MASEKVRRYSAFFQRVVFFIFIFLFGTLLSGEFGVKKPTIRLEASREHFGIFWKGLSSAREPFENAASMTWMPNKKIQGAGCANMCAIPWKPNCIEKVSKNGILVLFHNRYRYTIYGVPSSVLDICQIWQWFPLQNHRISRFTTERNR